MDYTAAQQHQFNAMAAQHMLAGMSDNPQQLRTQDPFAALMRQCWDAKHGHTGGMNYMTVPF
jgi:hypothetical protein